MKRFLIAAAVLSLMAPVSGAFAQNWNNHNNNRHDDHHGAPAMTMRGPAPHAWHKGDHFDRNNWGRYQRVDYRRYHLSAPPRGYEWRRVDNNYVLAAAATGLIASVIAASN